MTDMQLPVWPAVQQELCAMQACLIQPDISQWASYHNHTGNSTDSANAMQCLTSTSPCLPETTMEALLPAAPKQTQELAVRWLPATQIALLKE